MILTFHPQRDCWPHRTIVLKESNGSDSYNVLSMAEANKRWTKTKGFWDNLDIRLNQKKRLFETFEAFITYIHPEDAHVAKEATDTKLTFPESERSCLQKQGLLTPKKSEIVNLSSNPEIQDHAM